MPVNEHKNCLDQLSESVLCEVIESLQQSIFWKDLNGVFLGCNSTFAQNLGMAGPEEIIGKTAYDLCVPKEMVDAYRADDREVIETGQAKTHIVEQGRRADGIMVWVETTKVPLRDENGSIYGVLGIYQDVTERKRAEEALRLDDSRLQALLELSQMTHASVQELSVFAMEEGVRLTGSTVGYVAFVTDDEQTLTMHAWSKQAMKECMATEKPRVYPISTTGLWGEAVRQRKPIITNDYSAPNPWKKGCPEGHVPITRHMNVPIFDEGRIVVVAGVGNKAGDYDESDVRQMTLLMDGMWRIIRRNQAEDELLRAEVEKRQFYRETIMSVTDGKLDITGEEAVAGYRRGSDVKVTWSSPAELSDARMHITEFCLNSGMPEDTTGLFLTAVGEAMTNALKHAGKGIARGGVQDGELWLSVADGGPGIAALSLPDATLRRGYSSKVSMGMGYSIMLEISDRIMLSTGSNGTTVVLFKNIDPSRPLLSLENYPDTWDNVLSP